MNNRELAAGAADHTATDAVMAQASIGTEMIEKRRPNVKHFNMGGGRYQMVVYPEPVHFEENGQWKEIDNTLEEAQDANGNIVLRSKANPLGVEFARESDRDSIVRLRVDGREMSWGFQPPNRSERRGIPAVQVMKQPPNEVQITESTDTLMQMRTQARYESIAPGMDVRYELRGSSIKEDIILSTRAALQHAAVYLPNDYLYKLEKDGSVQVLEQNGAETPFSFSVPFAYDGKGDMLSVQVELVQQEDYTCMRYLLNEDELDHAALPITIDPAVNTRSGITYSAFKKGAATGTTSGRLKSGKKKNETWATVLRLNDIDWDGMSRSDTVTSAYLTMTDVMGRSANFVAAYRVLQPWQGSTVNWETLRCDGVGKPENDRLDPVMLDCVKGAGGYGTVKLNITRAYRAWKDGETNQGILLCSPHIMTKDNYMEFTRPTFYVNYISHAGMAGWWQYERQAVGRAGNVNVDIFNGNLVYVHPDMQLGGNRMPVGVSHVYNSCLSASNADCAENETNPKRTNDFHCGKGFKLSVQQCVDQREAGGSAYFVWTDGTGLEHWFKKKNAKQKSNDLEGMGLKLIYYKREGNKLEHITITDKAHTVMTFKRRTSGDHAQWNNYWLTEIRDSIRREAGVYNTNEFSYEMPAAFGDASAVAAYEGMVSAVKDAAGRTVSFVYDDARRLTQINWPGTTEENETQAQTRSAYFAYDADGRLTDIGYYDLQTSTEGPQYQTKLSYDGALLTRVENPYAQAIEIAYDRAAASANGCSCECPYCCNVQEDRSARVRSLEFIANTTDGFMRGTKQLFEYDVLKTRVIAVENAESDRGKALTYQFNESGNVVSVLDELGFAQFAKFDPATPNQPQDVSRLMKVVINRLKPFSADQAWTQDQGQGAVIGYNKAGNTQRIMGTPTAKLPAGASISQKVMLSRGETYTASAYAYLKAPTDDNAGDFTGVSASIQVAVDGNTYASVPADIEMMRQENLSGMKGWARMRVRFAVPEGEGDAEASVRLVNAGEETLFFGWPQLERGEIANHVNLLDNADFSQDAVGGEDEFKFPRAWSAEKEYKPDAENHAFNPPDDFPKELEGRVLQITATPNQSQRNVFQTLPISGAKNTVFTFGGWAKAAGIPGEDGKAPFFDLAISFRQKNGGKYSKSTYLTFNKNCRDWQFACRAAIAPCDFTSVRVHAVFSRNAGKALFSDLFLNCEAFGQSFVYDDDKDVISVTDRAAGKTKVKYDSAKNVIAYRKPGKSDSVKYESNYGSTDQQRKEHLPRWTRTPAGITTKYTYDKYGNTTTVRTQKTGQTGNNDSCIGAVTEYTEDGLFAVKSIDARGKTSTKTVDSKLGLVRSVTDPMNTSVMYEYDGSDRVSRVSCTAEGRIYENRYTYSEDRLKTVSHNTTNNADDAGMVEYSFDYDALGRKTSVKVGGQTLSKNVYAQDRSGLLKEVDYGNGGKVRYAHDEFDRPTGVCYDDEPESRYRYTYDAEGRVAEVDDTHLNRRARSEYDLAGRPVRATHSRLQNGQETIYYRTRLGYAKDNNLTEFNETVDSTAYKTRYKFDNADRMSEQSFTAADNEHGIKYSYDGLGRLSGEIRGAKDAQGRLTGNDALKTGFSYADGDTTRYGSKAATSLVKGIVHGSNALGFAYTYDDTGNILTVKQYSGANVPDAATVEYTYDKLGQLTRVNDRSDPRGGTLGTTWIYDYDCGGNITQKRMYAYTAGNAAAATLIKATPYAYDAVWRDKLVSYDGLPIDYDEIGNPIRYNGRTCEWKAGRQLTRMRMRTAVGNNGIEAQDGVDTASNTRLRIEFSDGNAIYGDLTQTRAMARIFRDGSEITNEYSEKVFCWTRESGDAEADAAWNAAHRGMREITLTAQDVPQKMVIRCSVTGTADAYGTMMTDGINLTHQRGAQDAGHSFGIENGNLMLYIPYTEAEALPDDPTADDTEEFTDVDLDESDLDDPEADTGDDEQDIVEPEEAGDVGDGTYLPGEEEAPDYVESVNDLPDTEYVPEGARPDEDNARIPQGINYLLENGELKIVLGLSAALSAWSAVYNTEPEEQLDFSYDASGLRVQKVYTTPNGAEITDYTLHGKLITHLTKRSAPGTGAATAEELHFFYDAQSRPAVVAYDGNMYYYRHNLQGDIVEIVDSSGNVVVEYSYDAWGASTGIEGTLKTTLGKLNPFRYRGYVYDEESDLYYLRSRYYDAYIMRFINADTCLGKMCRFDHALFTYCTNDPIQNIDPSGLTGTPWEMLGIYYDGSVRDFRRLERGLPPLAYEKLVKNGGRISTNHITMMGAGVVHRIKKVRYYTYRDVCDLLDDIDRGLEAEDYRGKIEQLVGIFIGTSEGFLIGVLLSLMGTKERAEQYEIQAAARRLRMCKDSKAGLLVIETEARDPDEVVLGLTAYYIWDGSGNPFESRIYGYEFLDK